MKSSTISDLGALFIDTWAWISLEDALHPAHAELRRLYREHIQLRRMWVTTDYVLDETVTRLFSRRPFAEAERFFSALFRSTESGVVLLQTIGPERFHQAYQLRLRFRDKPRISFTDLTSFVVMQELGIRTALTGDAHFRQAGFQVLP